MKLPGKVERKSTGRTAVQAAVVAVKIAFRVKEYNKSSRFLSAILFTERALNSKDVVFKFCFW